MNQQSVLPINPWKVRRRLSKVLAAMGQKGAGVSILITQDEEIKGLNRDFRGLNKSTNVLAFPDTDLAKGFKGHLGDIAISAETILREAQERKTLDSSQYESLSPDSLGSSGKPGSSGSPDSHSWPSEPGQLMYFYLIHALLHLVGYDHELGPSEEKRQNKETVRLLSLIKLDL
ncbi:MAG: rRNA maturation RNase YbeY [Deltaproteobacteria bacterium]|nr:rRNA maturation RNase YbeY [Deltaproteobacteria bacterium]